MEKRISELYPLVKDCYIITDRDEIINQNTGNHIKILTGRDGYRMVSLMKKGGGTTYLPFHRIKMMAFNPIPDMEKFQVNHIDGNKNNNNLSNLEWVTAKENIHHAWRTGLASSEKISCEKSNLAHYSREQAEKVVELLKTNQFTDKEIGQITQTNPRSFVARIRRKETWKELTKDIDYPLGKSERKSTFNKKSSTTSRKTQGISD